MLPRNWLFYLTLIILFATLGVSFHFSTDVYRALVWPHILIFLGYNFIRHTFFVMGAFLEDRRNFNREKSIGGDRRSYVPRVSIIVPAFNEEKVIAKSIESLAGLNYPNFEIIVVDDGSTDSTYMIASTASELIPHIDIKVLCKQNGGKAAALNYGFMNSTGELILCVDADSKVHKDSLYYGVQHFRNPRVGAVAGYVDVDRPDNTLKRLQLLEYMISLNFVRKAYSFLGIIPIIPGPVGLFRRAALESVKGLSEDKKIFAEDAEMSLRIITAGWVSSGEENMVSYTQAPESLTGLLRQRYRWNRGNFQALAKNFSCMLQSKNHLARFLAIHLYIEIWIIPVVNILIILNFLIRLFLYGETNLFTIWIAFGVFLDLWVLMIASFKRKKFIWSLGVMFISKVFYDNLLFFWKLWSLFDEWRDKSMTWDKLERQSNLSEVHSG